MNQLPGPDYDTQSHPCTQTGSYLPQNEQLFRCLQEQNHMFKKFLHQLKKQNHQLKKANHLLKLELRILLAEISRERDNGFGYNGAAMMYYDLEPKKQKRRKPNKTIFDELEELW